MERKPTGKIKMNSVIIKHGQGKIWFSKNDDGKTVNLTIQEENEKSLIGIDMTNEDFKTWIDKIKANYERS